MSRCFFLVFQVPQMILDDAKGKRRPCNVIVTQPRRIAARSVAERVARERGWELGTVVGYQVMLNFFMPQGWIVVYLLVWTLKIFKSQMKKHGNFQIMIAKNQRAVLCHCTLVQSFTTLCKIRRICVWYQFFNKQLYIFYKDSIHIAICMG